MSDVLRLLLILPRILLMLAKVCAESGALVIGLCWRDASGKLHWKEGM